MRHGDTLVTVADRFSVSVEQLKRWNHLSSNAVKPGRVLTVAEPVKLAPGMRTRSREDAWCKRIAQCVDATHCQEDEREILFDKEEFHLEIEEHLSQIEVESCTISYPTKKIACHCWHMDASCC